MRLRICQLALVLVLLVGCGAMAEPSEHAMVQAPEQPRAGRWTLAYTGGCAGRESETIQITRLDEEELVFGDFHLRRNAEGVYEGSAHLIAPMPADGRDVIYTIAYALSLGADGAFGGSEIITEDGGDALACPIRLVQAGG